MSIVQTDEFIEAMNKKERTCPYCKSNKTESKGYRNQGLPNEAIRYTCLACGKSHSRYTATGEVIKREKKPKKETVEEVNKLIEQTDKRTKEVMDDKMRKAEADAILKEPDKKQEKDIANQTLNVRRSTKSRVSNYSTHPRDTADDILNRLMDLADKIAEKKKRRQEQDEEEV